MDLEELGRRVKTARLRAGWSKEQAAREAALSSITWKRVEDGLPVQDVNRRKVLDVLKLDDKGEARDVAAGPYVASPGPHEESQVTNADILRALHEMTDAIREMNEGSRRLADRLDRWEASRS